MKLKSRFAPSPTGLLHIGNARSAVLNWAYITSKGGEFVLRIDDTDVERCKIEYEQEIKNDLKWLGINWTKTFNQSTRSEIYKKQIEVLKNKKRIYPCFESPEELSLKRKSLLMSGKPPIYDRSSLQLSDEQINNLIQIGKKPHWRFKLNNNIVEWNDLIKGKISFDSKKLSDPIIIREDGSLLYHLPSVIDDIEENITDVIRGEDHITNTAFHIQIFEALNAKIPSFGHHPLLTDYSGKGFGKRLGSLSIKNLNEDGFENITILNYLLSIGTSKNLTTEKNKEDLLKKFNIQNLSKSSPKFFAKDLQNLNKEIIKSYEFHEISNKFNKMGLEDITEQFWIFVKHNINFFSDVEHWWKVVNDSTVYIKEKNDYLHEAAKLLPEDPFDEKTWEIWTSKISSVTDRNGMELYMPLRMALTGQKKGPELKFLMPLLTRKHVLKKLGL